MSGCQANRAIAEYPGGACAAARQQGCRQVQVATLRLALFLMSTRLARCMHGQDSSDTFHTCRKLNFRVNVLTQFEPRHQQLQLVNTNTAAPASSLERVVSQLNLQPTAQKLKPSYTFCTTQQRCNN